MLVITTNSTNPKSASDSFLSYQPLTAPQNMSPTRTDNPIHDPHGTFNSQTGAIQVLVSKNSKQNLN